jgi:hypothetical protein
VLKTSRDLLLTAVLTASVLWFLHPLLRDPNTAGNCAER